VSWPGLLCLAAAYALYEEGIVSRALFDPQWPEAGALTAFDHAVGVNWTYGFVLVHFHVAVSIGASILLAELLFPDHRGRPWLTGRQAALCGLVLGLWAPVLALLARADGPLFTPPPGLWLLTGVAIVGLVTAARVARPPVVSPPRDGPPRPPWFFLLGAVNTTAVFVLVFMVPGQGVVLPLLVSVPLLILVDALAFGLWARWSGGGAAWRDGHRLALVAGVLAFFVAVNLVGDLERFEGKSLVALGTVLGLLWVRQRLARRREAPEALPPAV
jgi:hypothetical protein